LFFLTFVHVFPGRASQLVRSHRGQPHLPDLISCRLRRPTLPTKGGPTVAVARSLSSPASPAVRGPLIKLCKLRAQRCALANGCSRRPKARAIAESRSMFQYTFRVGGLEFACRQHADKNWLVWRALAWEHTDSPTFAIASTIDSRIVLDE